MDQHWDFEAGDAADTRILIAGGGTGGHLFPGVAIAEEISRRYGNSETLFVTGRRKIESEVLSRFGFHQVSIHVEGLKGRGVIKGIMVLLKLPYSFFQAISIIRKFSPHLVLGVGGYSAGPVCLAARIMGIPTAIHEQNSFPGLTNRLLCRIVDRVFISFAESKVHFAGGSIHLTGNPIREELFKEKKNHEKVNKRFTILIVGGSQGARAINQAFLGALEILKSKGKDPQIIHQTGETDHPWVLEEYRKMGFEGEVTSFIHDMAKAYQRADIVVSRAGATTVSELAALGKPSILIPYPYAANRHQDTNALILADIGGAEILYQDDLSGEGLAALLIKYMDDGMALEEMGKQVLKIGRRDAAKVIADQLAVMMNG
ncbi:MAG: undecaprenyldiphospho-muramoylpentapeptide beta-N-acetylglucosaminyltransferase [Deltaproteobacteria bacterium]|nr:undecaprenyldiphospho-muramoylpentapeptide beta-N-acetylglucosaminyltransferase [Deltaproteobacteria bacterium]